MKENKSQMFISLFLACDQQFTTVKREKEKKRSARDWQLDCDNNTNELLIYIKCRRRRRRTDGRTEKWRWFILIRTLKMMAMVLAFVLRISYISRYIWVAARHYIGPALDRLELVFSRISIGCGACCCCLAIPGVPINDLIMNTLKCLFYVILFCQKSIALFDTLCLCLLFRNEYREILMNRRPHSFHSFI